MIVDVSDGYAVAISVVVWAAVSGCVGWWATTWPRERLERAGPFTTLRAWEEDGTSWNRVLGVRRWKDLLPEAGGFFSRGVSKRHLGSGSTADLAAFRRETIRAERVHWLILASTPVQFIWCRPAIAAGMVVFGIAFNVPFIIVQRFNRGRVDRILSRRSSVS